MHVDISEYEGCDIQSFDLRPLKGKDSLAAVQRSVDPKGNLQPGFIISVHHRNNMIAEAITHVNGEPVVSPYVGWDEWSIRTQEFVVAAYDKLNNVSAEEMKSFLAKLGKKATPTPPPSAQP